MTFTEQFTKYESPFPAGVKLPKIVIEQKYYDMLECDSSISNFEFLRKLCFHGVKRLGIDKFKNKKVYYDRLSEEIQILNELGFVDYILLNWEVMNYCHENNIPTGMGRGSAAGSLVLYCLGVTAVDPIKYDLFFERFVSKSRARKIEHNGEIYLDGSLLADVDNDISYDRRSEVIEYIDRKYAGKTSKILTLNTLSSKLCIKECGKIVGGLNESEVNDISDTIPKHFGKVAKIEAAMEESGQFKKYCDTHPKMLKIAKKLEGLVKNTGVHPSGICISRFELGSIIPLQKTNDGHIVAGYDMDDVASLSVKFDILGLRTLSVVHETCRQLGIKMTDIDVNHPSIYAALQTLQCPQGLFQIEADTNFKVCQEIAPRNLEQLSAVVAIARPGALDFKDDYAVYARTGDFQSVHPFFDDVLGYTGGIPLYQEQLMKMAVKVGFTLDESEQLRRIVGKKKVDEMPAWKAKIEEKIKANKLDPKIGEVLWKVAEDSANYSFNKSHALSYACLAAITVYLKFNHPQEFFLSLLKMANFEPNPLQEIAKISAELNIFNIKLLPPDLNKSGLDFEIDNKNIRYGLNSIKGVSEKVLEALVEFRGKTFENKYEAFLCAKQSGLNIGVVSAFIQAGMLDSLRGDDGSRCRLVLEAQTFNILTDREKRNIIEMGPKYGFDVLNTINACVQESIPMDDGRQLFTPKRHETFKKKYTPMREIFMQNKKHNRFANWFFETKLLGYSYSENLKDVFLSDRLFSSLEAKESAPSTRVKIVGVVTDVVSRTAQSSGNKYARIQLQDDFGSVSVMLMNNRRRASLTEYLDAGNKLPKNDDIVIVEGSTGDDIVFIEKITPLQDRIYMKLSELK